MSRASIWASAGTQTSAQTPKNIARLASIGAPFRSGVRTTGSTSVSA